MQDEREMHLVVTTACYKAIRKPVRERTLGKHGHQHVYM